MSTDGFTSAVFFSGGVVGSSVVGSSKVGGWFGEVGNVPRAFTVSSEEEVDEEE